LHWHAPSVARDGTVYFTAVNDWSAEGARLGRWPARQTPHVDLLLVVAPGETIRSTYIAGANVYYDAMCAWAGGQAGIYRSVR